MQRSIYLQWRVDWLEARYFCFHYSGLKYIASSAVLLMINAFLRKIQKKLKNSLIPTEWFWFFFFFGILGSQPLTSVFKSSLSFLIFHFNPYTFKYVSQRFLSSSDRKYWHGKWNLCPAIGYISSMWNWFHEILFAMSTFAINRM